MNFHVLALKTIKTFIVPLSALFLGTLMSMTYRNITSQPRNRNQSLFASNHSNHNPWVNASPVNQALLNNSGRVWFIMTTRFDIKFQEPKLVRIAQALYPSRNFVTWVIISENTRLKFYEQDMQYLQKIVQRFSIPYVLLSTAAPGFGRDLSSIFGNYMGKTPKIRARQLGLIWVLQNVGSGVGVFANDEFTYHFKLFEQIQHTQKLSLWPIERGGVGIAKHFVRDKKDKKCFVREPYKLGVSVSGVAFNIEYCKDKALIQNIWKLATERRSSILAVLGIAPTDLEALDSCDQALVWRTQMRMDRAVNLKHPKQYLLNPNLNGTNVESLLKYIYRDKFGDHFSFKRNETGKVHSSQPATWSKKC